MINRKPTRAVKVGSVTIGGGAPVSVQSMTNTDTCDVEATLEQINRLAAAGCDIVRLAVPTHEAAKAFGAVKARAGVPLVADIHFDYRLALECLENGADKIRLNPGNIGGEEGVAQVAKKAREYGVPIRIGVNSGSIEPELIKKYGRPCPQAMVDSALGHVALLNKYDFDNIVISLKSSRVADTIEAYRLISEKSDYPLHLGVTEAGTLEAGTVKSAVGVGSLLSMGIGDTLRVSLTADPVAEVEVGIRILKSLSLRSGAEVVSCPTCGRCRVDLIKIANRVEGALGSIHKPVKVAVMGCAVNGPGEAREADVGVACGKGEGLIFVKGRTLRKVKESEIVDELLKEIERL